MSNTPTHEQVRAFIENANATISELDEDCRCASQFPDRGIELDIYRYIREKLFSIEEQLMEARRTITVVSPTRDEKLIRALGAVELRALDLYADVIRRIRACSANQEK
jgi:hypothetical protein